MANYNVIGKPVNRVDGPEKVTGAATFGVDVSLPGTLWCKILRSPHPSARILSVDASRALALPGVRGALTGEDVRGMLTGNTYKDEPVLAWDRVRFAGEKVAAVCADDEETAERALGLVEVGYEELPAVFDARQAAEEGAPILHPDFNSYEGVIPLPAPGNIYGRFVHESGNVDDGFAEADFIVEQSYETPRHHHIYLEPHACQVWIDPDGIAQVWLATQMPSGNRDEVARVLGLEPDQLVVNFSYLGGSYGGKTDATGVVLCYLMARATGRPVKMVMDYSEELTAMNPRHPSSMTLKAGVKGDGTLTAWQGDLFFATGAYTAYAPVPTMGGLPVSDAPGPYKTPNVRIDCRQVYTNTVPCGWFRGPGSFQTTFAGESHMDLIAERLGIDPVELRLRNIIHDGQELGIHRSWAPVASPDAPGYQHVRLEETLRTAAETAGYYDAKPSGVGRGVAISNHAQMGGDWHASVSVHPDGEIVGAVSTFSPGMGTYTILAQVIAEELAIPVEWIRVQPWSTADGPGDFGVAGDRGARLTTLAGHLAATELKEKLRTLAAELLGWPAERLEFENGDVVDPVADQRIGMVEIARRLGEPVTGRGDVDEPYSGTPYTSFSAHVAEVSVDRETGQVRLLRYTAAHETGRVLNPAGFHGQVNGGIVQGLGHTVMEELEERDGRIVTNTFLDYKIPTSADAPDLRTVVLDSPTGHAPYDVRGIGSNSITLVAPAIANAIADACGERIVSLPIGAEKVYGALRSRRDGE